MTTLVITILAYLAVWYVVSEILSWLICVVTGVLPAEYDTDQVRTTRAGVFMAPAWIPLLLLAVVTWWLLRAGHAALPWLVPAPNRNPMEYFL